MATSPRSRILGALLLVGLALLMSLTARAQSGLSPVGINLAGPGVASRSQVYIDVMRTTLPWGNPNTPWDGTAPVDANGWPTGDAGVFALDGTLAFNRYQAGGVTNPVQPPELGGLYRLSFKCNNPSGVAIDAWGETVQNVVRNPNGIVTAEVKVAPGANKNLFLSFRNTNGGVREVRLLRPGYAVGTTALFTNSFLNLLTPFTTLRCMDLLNTNTAPTFPTRTLWADRSKVTDARLTGAVGKGVPWEHIVELAKVSRKDLWISVPVAADDDYVRNMATLLKNNLPANTKIYLEYSNEVWNSGYPQYAWNLAAARDEVNNYGTTNDPIRLNENVGDWRDVPNYEVYQALKRVAKRLVQISTIFRDTFGESALPLSSPNARIRPVLASQLGYPYVVELQLLFLKKYYNSPKSVIYAIAGAPYINIQGQHDNNLLTTDQIVNLYDGSRAQIVAGGLLSFNTFAAFYGVPSLCYEGGLDNASSDGQPHSLLAKYNAEYDKRTATIAANILKQWYGQNGSLFMYFADNSAYDQFGAWGLTESATNLTAPKYVAIRQVALSARPPLTGGLPIASSGTSFIPAPSYVESIGGRANTVDAGNGVTYIRDIAPITHFDYPVRVVEAGDYKMTVQVSSAYTGGKLELALDDDASKTWTFDVPNTGNATTWNATTTVTATLTPGMHGLRLTRRDVTLDNGGANGFSIRHVEVVPTIHRFPAMADAYVRNGVGANSNYGGATETWTNNSGQANEERKTYLTFDTAALTGGVTTVKLRLVGSPNNPNKLANAKVACYPVTQTGWSEPGLTWNSAPANGATALATNTVTRMMGQPYEWDVTDYVKTERAAGRTKVTFLVACTNSTLPGVRWVSRENPTNGPQLVVTP